MRGIIYWGVVMMSTLSLAQVRPVWQDAVPGRVTAAPERAENDHLYDVACPTIELFMLSKAAPLVLVAPGGGYHCLAYTKEGVEVAKWLNGQGFHAAVLKYRIPGDRSGALMDAQEALRVLHAEAEALHITAFGMIGFSAGAHLTARVLHDAHHGLTFALLVYPAYLSADGVTLMDDVIPSQPHVPTFITQARDDYAFVMSSLGYAGHLLKANAAVAYHLYESGGHGQGLRYASTLPMSQWKAAAEAWLSTRHP